MIGKMKILGAIAAVAIVTGCATAAGGLYTSTHAALQHKRNGPKCRADLFLTPYGENHDCYSQR